MALLLHSPPVSRTECDLLTLWSWPLIQTCQTLPGELQMSERDNDKGKLMVHHSLFTTETTYFYKIQWHILDRYINKIFHWVFHTKVFLVRRGKGVDVDESMPTHLHSWKKTISKQNQPTKNGTKAKQNFQNVPPQEWWVVTSLYLKDGECSSLYVFMCSFSRSPFRNINVSWGL